MRKGYTPRGTKRSPHLAITHPITVQYMDDATINRNVTRFVTQASGHEFRTHLYRLCTNPRTRIAFGGNATTLEQIANARYYEVDQPRVLQILTTLIEAHRTDLVDFSVARRAFETAAFFGDYPTAERHLTSIRSRFGESLWLIRSNILLHHLQHKTDEMERYAQECRSALGPTIGAFLTNSALIVTINPASHLDKTVRAVAKEFATANHAVWADLLTLSLLPQEPQNDALPLDCFSPLQVLPVIDQSITLRCLLSHNGALTGHATATTQGQGLLELINEIDYAASHLSARPAVTSERLIGLYEHGEYDQFLQQYFADASNHWRPLALANLVAKAHAFLHRKVPTDTLFGRYISSLVDLYALSPHPHAAESSASEVIAIVNHFSDSYDLQFGLVKAMPHRFSTKSRCWTALRNRLYYRSSSPWGDALAQPADPLLSHRYQSDAKDLPPYRKIKQALQKTMAAEGCAAGATIELHDLLGAFRQESRLKRDYLELSASALLHISDFDSLISEAAQALAVLPAAYTALPLAPIVSYIEDHQVATLDALVVTYFYATRVDKSKEYVLGDLYEEFLHTNGASKPSDLIGSCTESEDARFVLFLSEISSLEMMDSLDCFESSSDLSAERIRIIDYLRAHEHISAESHSLQADEIVTRVVVDTTATGFSVAKVDVDDDAIKREIYSNVAGLVAVYNSFPPEDTDRIIQIPDDSTGIVDGLPVVVGDKGATLSKIIDLAIEAFVNNEKYGLARNLSAEIRHGFFSNLMRARLEEANLLTELGANNRYLPNVYWLSKYDFVAEDLMADVDNQLNWFSDAFNRLVSEAEEWMKVATLPTDSASRVFRFDDVTHEERQRIREAVELGETESIITVMLQLLWERTESALAEVRKRINGDLRERTDALFSELMERIDRSRRGASLIDLTESLHATRAGLHEDITTITEWFCRTNAAEAEDRTIPELVRISVECLNRVRGTQLSPRLDVSPSVGKPLSITRHVRAFIIALVNLLENAIRHSGNGSMTDVAIDARGSQEAWKLRVTNGLSDERIQALDEATVEAIRKKIAGAQAGHLSHCEGGSGLRKVANHLTSIDERYRFSIEVVDNCFEATVEYDDNSSG